MSDKRSVAEEAAWRATGGALEEARRRLEPTGVSIAGLAAVEAIFSSARLQESLDSAREYGISRISESVFDAIQNATRISLDAMGLGDGVVVKASELLVDAVMKGLGPTLGAERWHNGIGEAAAKSLAPLIGAMDWSGALMGSAGAVNLLKITSNLVGNPFTDKIAKGTWDSFYVPGGDDAEVADRVTGFLSDAAGTEGNARVLAEAEAIAQEPERVRRVLKMSSFSWSSSRDVAALDKEADRIERKYGAGWWTDVMAVVGDGWSSAGAAMAEGIEALTPRRLALFAAGLSLAGAGIVGPVAAEIQTLPSLQTIEATMAQSAAPLVVDAVTTIKVAGVLAPTLAEHAWAEQEHRSGRQVRVYAKAVVEAKTVWIPVLEDEVLPNWWKYSILAFDWATRIAAAWGAVRWVWKRPLVQGLLPKKIKSVPRDRINGPGK